MKEKIIQQTKNWLNNFVIHYNICPFAKKVYIQNQIGYTVGESENEETLLHQLAQEMRLLNRIPASEIDTSLFIIPNALTDFYDFLDFVELAELILAELNLEGVLQIATFHPKYQFAGTEKEDVENFTNRSPYPMLHLIREDSMEQALKNYPNPEEIPNRNIALMNKLGSIFLLELMKKHL